MTELERLEEIKDLRKIWPHEALDFTPWLASDENIGILSNAIGLEITVEETESSVGNFNSDIYAVESGTDRRIIIENQLADTDHDHLGKIITYASGKSADAVVWVVKRARDEHRSAIEWLNNHTDLKIGFFLCEIKLYKIGNSKPAVKFEVIEKPNDWSNKIRKEAISTPSHQFRYEYWTQFNEYAENNALFIKNFHLRKASTNHWMDFSIGKSDCHLAISIIQKRNAIDLEFYINDDKTLFDKFYNHKTAIETETGLEFDWRKLPDNKASRIIVEKNVDLNNRTEWNSQFDWIMDSLIKMKKSFKKYME